MAFNSENLRQYFDRNAVLGPGGAATCIYMNKNLVDYFMYRLDLQDFGVV